MVVDISAKFAECHIGGHLEFSIDTEKRHLKDHRQRNISAMFVVLDKKLKKKYFCPRIHAMIAILDFHLT
jgi:hypothetical protein